MPLVTPESRALGRSRPSPAAKPRKGGAKKPAPKRDAKIGNPLLAATVGSEAARCTVRALLNARVRAGAQPIVRLLPAGSFAETAAAVFQQRTDIPLELPVFQALALVAAQATEAGVRIQVEDQAIHPTLWLLLLGPSGAGKSWSLNNLCQSVGYAPKRLPEAASAAAWLEDLDEHNGGWWVRDEVGQLFKQIGGERPGPLFELKDYLLRAYDHSAIERRTKKGTVKVERPVFGFFGLSVGETWNRCVPADSYVDGFAQRFNYVIFDQRADRVVPLYRLGEGWKARLRERWDALCAAPLHPAYNLGEEGVAAYEEGFRRLHQAFHGGIPMSFFRRVAFTAIKYGLVYHRLRLDPSDELTAADVGWGFRVVERHLADAGRLIEGYGASELDELIARVETAVAAAKLEGRELTPRQVMRTPGLSSKIKNSTEARALLDLVRDESTVDLRGDDA